MSTQQKEHVIPGIVEGRRVDSRTLEERIQKAVARGHKRILIEARGQHGIGGRLWQAGDTPVNVEIVGPPGQRVGSMGFPNTRVEVLGPASDDTGWLNAGAEIVIQGNAGNGTCNAMAQGAVYINGSIGARGMTMTKANPRFAPPELWVLGSVGDYFAEFMAGGNAVVCGYEPQSPDNVLGYRPSVGMVRGRIYFRGPHSGFSQVDAKLIPMDDESWDWLAEGLRRFLDNIGRPELHSKLARRKEWQLIEARTPQEKMTAPRRSMGEFYSEVWEREMGRGAMLGDLLNVRRGAVPLITTGEWRRFVPVWENRRYTPPCEASCPTGMPVQERWRLIRDGRVDEAVDMALAYTPFPATVCGYLCPNLCMQGCTRSDFAMAPVDVSRLGKSSVKARVPELPPLSGKRVAVVGGGPAGISVAWQLRLRGHEAVVYDMGNKLGGKISSVIPGSRIPSEVLDAELGRISEVLPHVNLQQRLAKEDVRQLKVDYDYVVVAAGAQKARTLNVPGAERMVPANDFLRDARDGKVKPGKRVVVIGAGNVGCDVATEAHRLGADDITLIDVQEPASFGREREDAEAAGATFLWPRFTREVTDKGVVLTNGETLPADTVVVSIGDLPDLDFLPDSVETERGFIKVDEEYRTSNPKIFAIGDAVRPGLLTDAIGMGSRAASVISDLLEERRPHVAGRLEMDKNRVTLEYFDPRTADFEDVHACGAQCVSCGVCRDCGICEGICPRGAIHRDPARGGEDFEMRVDPEKCIGCGFCVAACPCGIWNLVENEPMDESL
ncbi:MAG: FAD-dependent oxidoreductase [Desulfatibacillaceae bacterium]